MTGYFGAALFVAIGCFMFAMQMHRNAQSQPPEMQRAWEVSKAYTTVEYRSKAKDLNGYVIRYSDGQYGPYRALKWSDGKQVLNEGFATFAEAQKAILDHAGVRLMEPPQ